ncbi:MAG: alkaline phosphatase family protein [Candidatus Cloacimonetes bacterium]|nr:alkaline phosphatase family protein [Candidatus Cloacimonadota bacterium]
MTKTTFPDYENSILNLMSSVLKHYGLETGKSYLKTISPADLSGKQNIILIILDGYGLNLLKKYSNKESNYLYSNLLTEISTVFPSTTTSAITSFSTAQTPLEHGSLGWALYFKEFFRLITYLPNKDHVLDTELDEKKYDAYKIISPKNIFKQINMHRPDVELHYLTQEFLSDTPFTKIITNPCKRHSYKKSSEMISQISKIVKKDMQSEKFIVGYSTLPDGFEHEFGVYSDEVKNYIKKIDKNIKELSPKLKGTNSTIIITADHGLIDIDEYIYLNEIPEIDDCLILPPFPEPRFVSFFVKEHKKSDFFLAMNEYKNDFLLMNRDEFFTSKILGEGAVHPKIDDFIGNYIAIATGKKGFKYKFRNIDKSTNLKANHCGITTDEMIVPLIKIDIL